MQRRVGTGGRGRHRREPVTGKPRAWHDTRAVHNRDSPHRPVRSLAILAISEL